MLTDAERQSYAERGFLIVKGVFDGREVAAALAAADGLLTRPELLTQENLRCRWQVHRRTGEPILDALDPIADLAPPVAAIAEHPKLLAVMAALFGEAPCLFKDKLIYKPPGSIGYALHQDYIAWPGFPRTFTTALVALDGSTAENGCLAVYAGDHRRGLLSPADGDYHDLPESLFDRQRRVSCPLAPGDVLVFGAFLPHGSGANDTDRCRRHLYLSYNARSDGGFQRPQHYRQFHAWLTRRYAEYGYVSSHFV